MLNLGWDRGKVHIEVIFYYFNSLRTAPLKIFTDFYGTRIDLSPYYEIGNGPILQRDKHIYFAKISTLSH